MDSIFINSVIFLKVAKLLGLILIHLARLMDALDVRYVMLEILVTLQLELMVLQILNLKTILS